MLAGRRVAGFLLVLSGVLGAALAGCGNPNGLDSIQVTPASESLNTGQTAQLSAIGTFGNAKHSHQQNVTTGVTWTSNKPSVATVDNAGLVTAVGAGTATISATAEAFNGQTGSSALVTVESPSGGGTGGSGGSILSLTIIPSGIVFGSLGDSGQFLAIGTFSTAPTVRDLTNSVTWITSEPNKFPITNNKSAAPGGGTENGGVVSAYEASNGPVGATITAEAKDTNGSIATATASVGCPLVLPNPPTTPGSCFNFITPLLTTLTVYNEGLDTADWEITAPSATGTAYVIHCGPGWLKDGGSDSVCTATYPINTTVTLTAPSRSDVKFGGWSSNCSNTGTISEAGPNHCTVTLGISDVTVGAIFNDLSQP